MFQVSSEFSWVKGPAVKAVEYHGQVAILSHEGGHAHSIVRGTEYLACCPTLQYARRYVAKLPGAKREVAA